ncbi:hypothetical protein C2E20_8848 [Micractinium conductrix]|uniref:JmjC domain-containing protein n=1 Tax=Micractinium conductrix TaxID=554055 RepID=A0A2P6V064_9CHLO|nr:hypothetical protein C2E20_8848 [Micractinium conductrix]PSC67483.1 hypothetical protein C2E20_8848 [Micractinium conductrix]|eukprot:PSC67482.1 hypothetical protein C2E20_8848 [Micractinium conductrix]
MLAQATLQPGGADGGAIGAAASAPPSAAGAAASDGQPAGHETTGSPCGWVGPGQTALELRLSEHSARTGCLELPPGMAAELTGLPDGGSLELCCWGGSASAQGSRWRSSLRSGSVHAGGLLARLGVQAGDRLLLVRRAPASPDRRAPLLAVAKLEAAQEAAAVLAQEGPAAGASAAAAAAAAAGLSGAVPAEPAASSGAALPLEHGQQEDQQQQLLQLPQQPQPQRQEEQQQQQPQQEEEQQQQQLPQQEEEEQQQQQQQHDAEALAGLRAQWSGCDASCFHGGAKPAFEESVAPVLGSLLALTCTDTYDAAMVELERMRALPYDLRRITIQCDRCHMQLAWTCRWDEAEGTQTCRHCHACLGGGGKELRLVAAPVLQGAYTYLQNAKAAGFVLPSGSLEGCQPECRQLFSGGAAALPLPELLAKLLALPEGEAEDLGAQAKMLWHGTFTDFIDAVAARQPGEDMQPCKSHVSKTAMRCVAAVCDAASARTHAAAAQRAAEHAAAAASACSAAACAASAGGRGARRLVGGASAAEAAAKAAGEAADHAKAAADSAAAAVRCARGAQRLADQLHAAAAEAAEQADLAAAEARAATPACAQRIAAAAATAATACSEQAHLAASEAQAAAAAGAAATDAAEAAGGSARRAAEEAQAARRPQAAPAKQAVAAGKRGRPAAGSKRQQGAPTGPNAKRPCNCAARCGEAALSSARTAVYALLLFFCTRTNCLLNLEQTGAPGLLGAALQAALAELGLVCAALAFSLVPDVDHKLTSTLIVGGAGSATAWHRDWSAAYNLVLAVCSGAAGVLATWFFCPPDRLAALDMWLRTNTKASSFAAAQSLSGDEWRALEAAAAGLGLLRREQRAGQLMFVPAGWPHCVRNECENVKVAWDLLELRHLHLYLRGLQDVSVPRKNKDYMLAEVFAIRFLSALFGTL